MTDLTRERPAIHVCLAGPSTPGLYRWVEVGAEEEGLPTRHVPLAEDDVVAAAFAAAQGSRFGIGVAIGQGRVVLHEAHMPPEHPVLAFNLGADAPHACRLMGSNAARMVVRLPLRLADELVEQPAPAHSVAHHRRSPYESLFRSQATLSSPAPAQREGAGGGMRADATELDIALVARIAAIVARILRERGIL